MQPDFWKISPTYFTTKIFKIKKEETFTQLYGDYR